MDVQLEDGDRIAIGDLALRAVSTPEHSSGHLAFLMDHDGRTGFFGGDLVFFAGQTLLQNAWDCDLQAHLRSIANLRDAGIDGFFPGHRSFCLKEGQRHIDVAASIIDGLLVPPNFTDSW